MSDDLYVEDFLVPGEGENEPRAIYERLVASCDNFAHLLAGEPRIEFLLRSNPKFKHGRSILGECHLPSVQGALKPMFDWMMAKLFGVTPDFLIILDRDFWIGSDELAREILIFHETMHCAQAEDKFGSPRFDKETGLPVWCIRGHDVEEFNEVVRRYGAYSEDIRSFIAAVGDANPNNLMMGAEKEKLF